MEGVILLEQEPLIRYRCKVCFNDMWIHNHKPDEGGLLCPYCEQRSQFYVKIQYTRHEHHEPKKIRGNRATLKALDKWATHVLQYAGEGKTDREIEELTGINKSTVYRIRHYMGRYSKFKPDNRIIEEVANKSTYIMGEREIREANSEMKRA